MNENLPREISWMGSIPEDYTVTRLGRLVEHVKKKNKGHLSRNLLSLSYGEIKSKNIDTADGLLPESFETYNLIEKDDIVLRLTDLQNDKRSLRSAISTQEGIITSAYITIRPTKIYPRFLAYYLRLLDNAKVFYSLGSGLRQSLSWDDVKLIPVVVPPFEKQKRIADQLDRELAEIDASITDQNQLLNLLHEHLKASISHHVQPVELAEQAGVSEITIDGISWRRTTIGRVTTFNGGQVDPRVEPYASMTLIAPNHIEKGTGRILSRETAKEQGADSGKYVARRGQLLFSKIRPTLLKSTIAPENCLCSADMYAISADENWLTNEFLMYYFLSKNFQDIADIKSERVAMPKLNKETLASTALWIPNSAKQNSVEEILRKEISETLKNISLLKKSIHLNKEKCNTIIKENLKQVSSR